ncbi:MAG: DUF3080 family protein [Halioglobus sp.]
MPLKPAKFFIAMQIFVLWLCGCGQNGPEQHLDNYLQRLANTLDANVPVIHQRSVPRLANRAQLRLDLPSANLGALDFLALRGCALQVTIGKRNSSLGRLASDSQRLLLELEYLQHAPKCIEQMRAEGRLEIVRTLTDAQTLKQQQLPGLIYNASLANVEFYRFWRKPAELGPYPANTSSLVISAVGRLSGYIQRWLSGDYRADNRDFEILLSEVAKGDGGALLQSLALQESRLAAGNTLLKRRLARGPLCAPGYRAAAADILPVVIRKYFIGDVQPWSAALGRRHYELLPVIERLEQQLNAALPETYTHWQNQRSQILSLMVEAPAAHVGQLKAALAPCQTQQNTPGR